MLSAYELNGYKDAALLANAQRLGDKLMYGWVPTNGPIPYVYFSFYISISQDGIAGMAQSTFRGTHQMSAPDP